MRFSKCICSILIIYECFICCGCLQICVPRSTRNVMVEGVQGGIVTGAAALLGGVAGLLLPPLDQAQAVGYQASSSIYAPQKTIQYALPLLPQSVLLNTLPLTPGSSLELVGDMQAYLESFVQLVNPSPQQEEQIRRNNSVLWTNLRINAQRAAGMFIYNRQELLPNINNALSSPQAAETRELLGKKYLDALQTDVLRLVDASRRSSVKESLRCMRYSLNSLCNVALMLVPEARVQASIASAKGSASDFNLPLLEGRALVTLEFKRNGGTPLPSNFVKLIVDGINYPLNGGNFIEFCLKGVYKNIPVACDSYSFAGSSIARTLLGVTKKGYIDPKTHLQRRVPLEVLREDDTLDRFTTVGSARNSAVFTRAKPVQSYASYGGLGMLHTPGDGNGASSSFFFVPPDRSMSVSERHLLPVVTRMNQRFSLFAHCIDGNDVLSQLQPNDVLLSAKVDEGAWRLIPPPQK